MIVTFTCQQSWESSSLSFCGFLSLVFFTERIQGCHKLLFHERSCHQTNVYFSVSPSKSGSAWNVEELHRFSQFDLSNLNSNYIHTSDIVRTFFPMTFTYSIKSLAIQSPWPLQKYFCGAYFSYIHL